MAKFKRFFKLKSSLKLLIAQDCLVSVQQQGASFITTGGFDVLFSLLQEYHNQAILFKMSYSQNHQTHVSFSKNVTINVILYGCSLRLRQPILSNWGSVWRHEGWRVPLKTCPSSSTSIASLFFEIVARLLSGEELEEAGREDRDAFLDCLEDHMHDVNSFVRCPLSILILNFVSILSSSNICFNFILLNLCRQVSCTPLLEPPVQGQVHPSGSSTSGH